MSSVLEQDIREKFRRSGYTLTSQRRAVLEALEEIGLIDSKHWSESPTRYDLNVEPHLDIRCARCGAVSEIPGVELGELEESIRGNTSYKVTRTTIAVEGLCPSCKAA